MNVITRLEFNFEDTSSQSKSEHFSKTLFFIRIQDELLQQSGGKSFLKPCLGFDIWM